MTDTIDAITADRALKARHRAMWALGDYPAATHWTGDLLTRGASTERVVCQNLGNGLSDLVVAAAVADVAESQDAGHVLVTTPS